MIARLLKELADGIEIPAPLISPMRWPRNQCQNSIRMAVSGIQSAWHCDGRVPLSACLPDHLPHPIRMLRESCASNGVNA